MSPPSEDLFILTPKTIRTKLWILVLAITFLLLARYTHGSEGYTDSLVLEEPPIAYVTAHYVPTPPRMPQVAFKVPRAISASCVLFVKSITGYDKPVGMARNWPINSTEPEIGSVVIFKYSHVAVITKLSSGSFEITEANYIKGKVGSRVLQSGDLSIKGYWSD